MGDGAKPFDYQRGLELYNSEGKSPAFYNALEQRLIDYETQNGILDGVADLQNDPDYQPPAPATPAPVATPEPAPMPAVAPQPAAAPQAEESLLEDFARGAGQGATLGMGDEWSSLASGLFPDPWKGQRATGRGFDAPLMTPEQETEAVRSEMLASERGANADAQERSPWAYGAGQVAGAAPLAVAASPVAPAGASLGVRAGQGALTGGAFGAAAGYGASEAETDAGLLEDAASAGGMGAALGGAAPAVGAAASATGRGIGKVADMAQRAGWRNRGVAPGTYGGEMSKMTAQQGRDLAERIGMTIEKYGAHKRPESSMLPSFVPQGAGTYATTLEAATAKAGQNMSAPIREAAEAGAQVDPRGLSMRLRDWQAGHLGKGQPNNLAIAGYADDIADDIAARQAGRGRPMNPQEAWDYRNDMKPTAKLEGSRNVMPAVNEKGQAYREGRDVIRDAIEESLAPEQRLRFQEGNTDYGLLKKAHNAALKRESQELGNQIMSINSPGAAAAGAVLGGSPGAAVSVGLTEGMKRVGRDVMADTLGTTSKALRLPAAAAQGAARAAEPAGIAAAARAPSRAVLDDVLDATPAMAQDEQGEQQAPQPQTQAQAGEHPFAGRIRTAMRAHPRALLKWGPELQKAEQEGSAALGATLARLQKDPEFVKQVLPVLAGRAGQQGAQ